MEQEWFCEGDFVSSPHVKYFNNLGRLRWCVKLRRDALVKARALIAGRGRAPTLFHRDFESIALNLMAEEQVDA